MKFKRTVKIPSDRLLHLSVPREIPAGAIAGIELIWPADKKPANAAGQRQAKTGHVPISRYFGIISPDTYGNGVVYQRKLRDEWDE